MEVGSCYLEDKEVDVCRRLHPARETVPNSEGTIASCCACASQGSGPPLQHPRACPLPLRHTRLPALPLDPAQHAGWWGG